MKSSYVSPWVQIVDRHNPAQVSMGTSTTGLLRFAGYAVTIMGSSD
jgi:hypothetical protein